MTIGTDTIIFGAIAALCASWLIVSAWYRRILREMEAQEGACLNVVASVAVAALCSLSAVHSTDGHLPQGTEAIMLMNAVAPDTTVIWDDSALRLICIAGSIGGALLSILLFPPTSARAMAGKMTASVLAGAMFTPVLLRWMNFPPDDDVMLCAAGIVALLSWSVLMICVPLAQGAVRRWLDKWLPTASDTKDKEDKP